MPWIDVRMERNLHLAFLKSRRVSGTSSVTGEFPAHIINGIVFYTGMYNPR